MKTIDDFKNKIIQGDCLEVMKEIPDDSIDMILCDLPYGTTNCKWDTCIDLSKRWKEYHRITKLKSPILLFSQLPFDKVLGCSNLKELRYEWIWEKTQATGHLNSKKMPLKAHENILVFYNKLPVFNPIKTKGHKPTNTYTKYVATQNNTEICGKVNREISGGGDITRFPRSIQIFSSDKQTNCIHPTQKPVALFEYLIKTYTNKGMIVLDNCIGSGTTAVACKQTGRNFIGIELSPEYCEIARKRVASVPKRLDMFAQNKLRV